MTLSLTPFTPKEEKKIQEMISFNELGLDIRMLRFESKKETFTKSYRFGILQHGQYSWFFNAKAIAKGRDKMREVYGALLLEYTNYPDATIFICQS